MSQGGAVDSSITVGRDANNCVITSGNGNTVILYQTLAAVATPLAGGKNPYLGLLAFTEADADRFFGREKLVSNLWGRFRDLVGSPSTGQTTRFLAILGPSGSGKSSLARAGLVPELARRPVSPRQQRVATMTPGVHPLQALALLLAKVATNDPVEAVAKEAELLALLQPAGSQASAGLRRIAGSLCADGQPLVLLIDQFEEIYSLCQDDAERKILIENLLDAASDPAGCVSVIVTLRSDFLGATQVDSRLNQLIAGQSVIIPAMSAEELRLAIAEPAIRAGHPIDEDTIQRLIAETVGRDGALPLLQFVLVRIWEGMVGGVTAGKTVADLGGVGGALGAEAERIFLNLGADDQIIARRAFLAMVQFNENERPTRHRAYLSELVTDGDGPSQTQALDRVHGVVSVFAQWDTRLVTMAATPQGDQTIEVSHEAIFEHWNRLRQWLADGMDDIRLHLRVADAAALWDRTGRPEGSLWRPPDLDLLRELTSSPTTSLSTIERTFFLASDQALKAELTARHRRELGVRIALGIFLILFLGAGGLGYAALVEGQKAELQRSNAFSGAARQAIDAGEGSRALLLGLAGVPPGRMDRLGFEAASTTVRAALANLSEVRAFVHPAPVAKALFAANDQRVVTQAAKTIRIWDRANGKLIATLPGDVDGVTVSPDGRRLATFDKQAVRIWNALSGAPLTVVSGPSPASPSFSPDGSRIAIAWTHQRAGVWSAVTGAALFLLDAEVDGLDFLPNGRGLLSTSEEGSTLLDADTGLKLGEPLKGAADVPGEPGFTQGGRIVAMLAEGGMRHPIGLWSLPEGKFIAKIPSQFTDPVFSSDASVLAVKDDTGQVHLLTDEEGAQGTNQYENDLGVATVTDGLVNDYALSPDGHWLAIASSGQTISLWRAEDGISLVRVLAGHTAPIEHVEFARDGRFILSASDDGTARLWRMTPGPEDRPIGTPPLAADHTLPVRLLSYAGNQGVQIWERMSGKQVVSAVNSSDALATLSPDGGTIFTKPYGQQEIAQLNAVTGKPAGPSIPAKNVYGIALSPDGSKLVTGGDDSSQIWDVQKGKAIGPPFRGSVMGQGAVSAEGEIAVTGDEGDAAIWNPSKGTLVHLKGHTASVPAAAFAHKGDDFVTLSYDKTGRIWNAKTAQPGPIFWLENASAGWIAEGSPVQAEYSPDDRQIVTVFGGAAQVWDAKTGQHLMQLPSDAIAAGWSPDGRKILVITMHGPQLVNVRFSYGEALRTEACRNLSRDFTADERRSYGLTEAEKPCAPPSHWLWPLNVLQELLRK